MNTEIIKDEIKWLLEAINEQFEVINGHGEKTPRIEFDILMENVRKFYEKMHLLKQMNDSGPLPREAGKAHATQASSTVGRVTEPEPEPEPGLASLHATPVPFKPSGTVSSRQETASTLKKTAKAPEMDLFASDEPVFSIQLKNAREKSLGPKIPSARIDNLKAAININEKFMFINELFDGNLREYNETIETLNGFMTLDQAADFLDLMRKKNFWNTGSNAFKKLKELVERRF